MNNRQKNFIGELLVQNKLITPEQSELALIEYKKTGKNFGHILIDMGFIKEGDLLNIISEQLKIPLLDLSKYSLKPEIVKKLPENLARRFRVLLLESNDTNVLLAMADPTDLMAFDELSHILKKNIHLALVKESDLLIAIDQTYRRTDEINVLAEQLRYELADDITTLLASDNSSDAPVVKLLKSVFEDAIQVRASDIHIEPQEQKLLIRFRIDGVLHLQTEADLKITAALVLRLKLMSGLDISEKRLPQDGRFHTKVRHQPVDVRISTMPTLYGESVVMRLLIQNPGGFSLEKLGMLPEILVRFRKLIHRPGGMVLLTGPTGSGKSTSIYAALSELDAISNKIFTIEDPVEYRLPNINQVQVNNKIDFDFARILRSVLRQDPDIILIGEMRDTETAQIGMRAAMTGHLVLSTLHTNDTISTPIRMIDMGVQPFIVAMSLLAVVAQRLVRKVCENCAQTYQPEPFEYAWLKFELNKTVDDFDFVQGKGCNHCNHTGYQGRIGVYELLEMNNELTDAISQNDTRHFIMLARQQLAGKTLNHNAIDLVIAKRTTISEAMRISTYSL